MRLVETHTHDFLAGEVYITQLIFELLLRLFRLEDASIERAARLLHRLFHICDELLQDAIGDVAQLNGVQALRFRILDVLIGVVFPERFRDRTN